MENKMNRIYIDWGGFSKYTIIPNPVNYTFKEKNKEPQP